MHNSTASAGSDEICLATSSSAQGFTCRGACR